MKTGNQCRCRCRCRCRSRRHQDHPIPKQTLPAIKGIPSGSPFSIDRFPPFFPTPQAASRWWWWWWGATFGSGGGGDSDGGGDGGGWAGLPRIRTQRGLIIILCQKSTKRPNRKEERGRIPNQSLRKKRRIKSHRFWESLLMHQGSSSSLSPSFCGDLVISPSPRVYLKWDSFWHREKRETISPRSRRKRRRRRRRRKKANIDSSNPKLLRKKGTYSPLIPATLGENPPPTSPPPPPASRDSARSGLGLMETGYHLGGGKVPSSVSPLSPPFATVQFPGGADPQISQNEHPPLKKKKKKKSQA